MMVLPDHPTLLAILDTDDCDSDASDDHVKLLKPASAGRSHFGRGVSADES